MADLRASQIITEILLEQDVNADCRYTQIVTEVSVQKDINADCRFTQLAGTVLRSTNEGHAFSFGVIIF